MTFLSLIASKVHHIDGDGKDGGALFNILSGEDFEEMSYDDYDSIMPEKVRRQFCTILYGYTPI